MIKKSNHKKIILLGIITFIIMLLAWAGICIMRGMKEKTTIVLDDGWTVKVNDKTYTDVDLATFTFRGLKRYDDIEISRVITDDLTDGYTVRVKAQFCSVQAYAGVREIFSFGTEEIKNNRFLGSGYVFIRLPYDMQGKNLKIRFIVNEDDSMTDIGSIRLEKSDAILRTYANRNATSVYLNSFIMIFGVALIILGFSVRRRGKDYLTLILIGAFSVLIGHWSNCQGKIYEIFSDRITMLSVHEFICLYTAPIPMAVYIWQRHKGEGGTKETVLKLAIAVTVIFDVTACILHVTNVARFPRTLGVFHLTGAICLVAIIAVCVTHIKKDRMSDLVINLAFFQVAAAAFLDIFRLNIQKRFLPNMDIITEVSFLPMGVIIFITMLTAGYLFNIYETVLSEAEREALTRIAYHDTLTGIYNRAKADQKFEELDATDSAAAMVNFDVNGLKYVNDNFGHEEGDKLLKNVAGIIEKCFGEIGTYYRMSGDEFLSIIVDPEGITNVEGAAAKFEEELKIASENSRYVISVSYGISYRKKGEKKSMQEVYSEADDKMYVMKEKSGRSRQALEGGMKEITEANS